MLKCFPVIEGSSVAKETETNLGKHVKSAIGRNLI